jgi:hypothetical protein
MLKKEAERSLAFGKPEKDLIEALLKNVQIENIGFYEDKEGRLCGAQTLKLSNSSQVISLANRVLGRQLKARLQEMREERNKKVPNSFTSETVDLIEKKTQADFPFIQIEGNLITLNMILTDPDQQRISKSTLTDLPHGTRIEFKDEALLIKIGANQDDQGKLWKECYEGYLPNALNHVLKNHKKLLLNPKKVKQRLQNFLSGTN